jgi:tRNA A-37 threonylcarbamoyl transferase component Bud32
MRLLWLLVLLGCDAARRKPKKKNKVPSVTSAVDQATLPPSLIPSETLEQGFIPQTTLEQALIPSIAPSSNAETPTVASEPLKNSLIQKNDQTWLILEKDICTFLTNDENAKKGSQGTVIIAESIRSNAQYAIKIEVSRGAKDFKKNVMEEHHMNQLVGLSAGSVIFLNDGLTAYLPLKYLEGITLHEALYSTNRAWTSLKTTALLDALVVEIRRLGKLKIKHGDLHFHNVMISLQKALQGKVQRKIIDFGSAQIVQDEEEAFKDNLKQLVDEVMSLSMLRYTNLQVTPSLRAREIQEYLIERYPAFFSKLLEGMTMYRPAELLDGCWRFEDSALPFNPSKAAF